MTSMTMSPDGATTSCRVRCWSLRFLEAGARMPAVIGTNAFKLLCGTVIRP